MKEVDHEIVRRTVRSRESIVALVAFCVAHLCCAEDVHDYSSYINLKQDLSITETTAGWPGPSAWEPEVEMKAGFYYLIPKDMTLSHWTKSGDNSPQGGTWPGEELAIAGVFNVGAKQGRKNVAVTPHLALLAGGRLLLSTAFGTIKGDTIDVRGTADNPALIEYDYATGNNKTTYYPLLDIAFTGDKDAVVKFRYTSTDENYDVSQRAFRVTGGFAAFKGTVIVDGENTWLRQETGASTFDVGGTLLITNCANVNITEVSPVFGSLVVADGSKLHLAAGRTVTVTDSLHLAAGAKIIVHSIADTTFVYANGSNVPSEVPVLSVCGAKNAEKVDRIALLSAITAGGIFFKSSVERAGLPRFRLLECRRDDGGVDFKVSYVPVVEQVASCKRDVGPYAHAMHETYLSDKKPISPDKDYYNPGWNMYFTSKDVTEYIFPGGSLTAYLTDAGRSIGFYSNEKVEIPDFRIIGEVGNDTRIRQMEGNGTCYLKGGLTLSGNVNFSMSGSGVFHLESSLCGGGNLIETLDLDKIIGKAAKCQGALSLEGDNIGFRGRILVGCGLEPLENSLGLTNLTLLVSSGGNLGGPCEEFVFDAVKIAKACKLSITDTATFDANNRGWCFMDGSAVDVAPGKVAMMKKNVTFGGESEKTGGGTLILGASAKFYDAENDSVGDIPNGATLRIAAGGIGVVSPGALTGVNLKFAQDAGLVVLPESRCMVLSSAPVLEGENLPIGFEMPEGSDSMTVDILSLPASVTFDSSKLSLPRKSGYAISLTTRQVDGNVIYGLSCKKIGFIISVR